MSTRSEAGLAIEALFGSGPGAQRAQEEVVARVWAGNQTLHGLVLGLWLELLNSAGPDTDFEGLGRFMERLDKPPQTWIHPSTGDLYALLH